MEIQKFKEISTSVYNNIQSLTPTGIEVLKEILVLNEIRYGRISTFSIKDSQTIILLTLKQNCLILIKFLLENNIELPDDLLDKVIDLLFKNDESSVKSTPVADSSNSISQINNNKNINTDLNAQMEISRIKEQIFKNVIDIIYITSYSNSILIQYLESRDVPDDASVNLSQVISCEYKSFELMVLNKLFVGPVLISLIESYKNKLRPAIKSKIIDGLINQIENADRNLIYKIFYQINEMENNDILKKSKLEHSPEYLGFVHSLILSKESATIAYDKITPFLEELEEVLNILANASKNDVRKIRPRDEELIERGLQCIYRLIKYRSINFYKFLHQFQIILKSNAGLRIKGLIYEILCHYVSDRNVYIEKVIDCQHDLEREFKNKNFFLLPRLIKFLHAYKNREEIEKNLLQEGKSLGSPYISNKRIENGGNPQINNIKDDTIEYKVFGLKSEDPETIIECFNEAIPPKTLELNSIHIRNAMIKDQRVIEKILHYQITHKVVLESFSIINLILCFPNPDFFSYARLFKDFSYYLSENVLERISDNTEEGIKWIAETYTPEVGKWIIKNSSYFNDMIAAEEKTQLKLLPIYDKMLEENLGSVEIFIKTSDTDIQTDVADTFFIFDNEELISEHFFRIFAKQLIYEKFYKNEDCKKFILNHRYSHPGYSLYLKAKIISGFDIVPDIKFMKANLINVDDIVGYFAATVPHNPQIADFLSENRKISQNILLNFGIKDSAYFLSNFKAASDFEKFILFFSLDNQITKEIDSIIKEEVLSNIKSNNKIYLRMCLIQLFKCSDIDNILKIIEKSFTDKELLFKLNLYNISIGGRYFSKELIKHATPELLPKALFLLYYMNTWNKDYIIELIETLDVNISPEIQYIKENIKDY